MFLICLQVAFRIAAGKTPEKPMGANFNYKIRTYARLCDQLTGIAAELETENSKLEWH